MTRLYARPRKKSVVFTGPLATIGGLFVFLVVIILWLIAALASLAVPTLIVLACLKILGVI